MTARAHLFSTSKDDMYGVRFWWLMLKAVSLRLFKQPCLYVNSACVVPVVVGCDYKIVTDAQILPLLVCGIIY
jgi:hypothetical protein